LIAATRIHSPSEGRSLPRSAVEHFTADTRCGMASFSMARVQGRHASELEAAKKAIWLAKKSRVEISLASIVLNLFVNAHWLTTLSGKALVLSSLAKKNTASIWKSSGSLARRTRPIGGPSKKDTRDIRMLIYRSLLKQYKNNSCQVPEQESRTGQQPI
jgi:hypothetical protein